MAGSNMSEKCVCRSRRLYTHCMCVCVACVLSFLHAIYFCSADSLTTVSLLWGARTCPHGFPLGLALWTLPNKFREGWKKRQGNSPTGVGGGGGGSLEMIFGNESKCCNWTRKLRNVAGVNGPVFMGPDQRYGRDKCDPQEQFQQSRFPAITSKYI